MRIVRIAVVPIALLLLLAIGGCGRSDGATVGGVSPATSPAAAVSSAQASDASPAVTLRYGETAQVELSVAGGARVFVDVWDPDDISAPPTSADVLLTTHTHDDHLSRGFQRAFPGQQLFVREGTIRTENAVVRGIAAAHSQGDPLETRGGTDYVFIVDIGGLRIAHLGDIGQTSLTRDQLRALGDVDVAITQLDNSFSQMDLTNRKGFALVDQLRPRLVIQTHTSADAVELAKTRWPILWSESPAITIAASDLPERTSLLMLGVDAASYADMVGATRVDW